MSDLYNELVEIERKLKHLEKKIKQICRQNKACQRIMKIPGVGELTATAMISAVPNPEVFRNGRHMSAWLGLVPKQHSSGYKQILLGISKRGDIYLRTLLIHGGLCSVFKLMNYIVDRCANFLRLPAWKTSTLRNY